MKFRFLTFLLAIMAAAMPLSAYDFMADGLCYNLNGDGTVTVTSGGSYADAVIIPESVTYNGATYSVTAIGNQAFYGCSGLSAVIIPGSVTSIGSQAFRNCSNLTWVTIPASVTTMGGSVFSGCSRLQSMLLLGTVCDYFTSGATDVRNLYLAPSVTSIKGLGISPNQVYCYGAVPALCDASTFNSYSGTLHVPQYTISPYFADNYWGMFESFIDDAVWADSISLSDDIVNLRVGETQQLTASLDPVPTGMAMQWFSTNPNVVEVSSNGKLTAKAAGEADVIAMWGGLSAVCHVKVVVTIELDNSELTLNVDDIVTITPSHTPSSASIEYTLTCSDNDVVLTQWKNGSIRILATKPGTAVITVGSSDGNAIPATCEVTVIKPLGDVNVDGRVTTVDVTCLYNYLLNGDETFAATSDINGDGAITAADITLIYNILIGNQSITPSGNHEYVDLGLPSGTLWATMNVGANSPEEYGDYFAWGETTPKDVYNWSTYKWCMGDYYMLTKYCTKSNYGYNGFTDGKTELDPEDDAATANWGSMWRMPSLEQIQELMDNCTSQSTTRNGVNGCLFTSNINSASLFLPAAGGRGGDLYGAGTYGGYLSRTLLSSPSYAYFLYFSSGNVIIDSDLDRCYGFTVRAVRVSQN